MAAEESPTVTLGRIERKQRNLMKKILRAQESGGLVRPVLYRAELEGIGRDLEKIRVECAVISQLSQPAEKLYNQLSTTYRRKICIF